MSYFYEGTSMVDESTAFEQDEKGDYQPIVYDNYNAYNAGQSVEPVVISSGNILHRTFQIQIIYQIQLRSQSSDAQIILEKYCNNSSSPQTIYATGAKIELVNIKNQSGCISLPKDQSVYKELNSYLRSESSNAYNVTYAKRDGEFIFITFDNNRFEHKLRLKYSNTNDDNGSNVNIEIYNQQIKNK